jgi:hypothetical protein
MKANEVLSFDEAKPHRDSEQIIQFPRGAERDAENRTKSACVALAHPSTMLVGIETAALLIWETRPNLSDHGKEVVIR